MNDQLLADCASKFQSTLQLKDKQIECLNYVLSGRDAIANLPVGYVFMEAAMFTSRHTLSSRDPCWWQRLK